MRRPLPGEGEVAWRRYAEHLEKTHAVPLALPPPPEPARPLLARRLCWQGLCYSHPGHGWTEDKPGGKDFWCPGVSTDRT